MVRRSTNSFDGGPLISGRTHVDGVGREIGDYAVVLAVDDARSDRVLALASSLSEYVDAFKIGVPPLLANGVSLVKRLKDASDKPVIADLKTADIGFRPEGAPEWSGTNRKILEVAFGGGIDYAICHAIVGTSSMEECISTAHSMGGRVLTLPFMTGRGAGLFFDHPLDMGHARRWLASLGADEVLPRLASLASRKAGEAGWRTPVVTVSDLIMLLSEHFGADGYIAPANLPQVMGDYRKVTEKRVFATGIARQGGRLADVFRMLGPRSAALIGHAIHSVADPVLACRTFVAERDALASGR